MHLMAKLKSTSFAESGNQTIKCTNVDTVQAQQVGHDQRRRLGSKCSVAARRN